METLWTPWRIGYIVGEKKPGCPLCDKSKEPAEKDKENYILQRREKCFVMLNLFPYTNGHIMIAPYEHIGELEALDAATFVQMGETCRSWVAVLKKTMEPQGFNIGLNLGRVAGAGITDHVHIHIVPRWLGDVNFMSVLSDTRLIPEALDATYDRLLNALNPVAMEGRG